jgi:hypothetical protein
MATAKRGGEEVQVPGVRDGEPTALSGRLAGRGRARHTWRPLRPYARHAPHSSYGLRRETI